MDTQLTAWLNEGLKHYAAGDHARALECWTRILGVEPDHPGALEYVAFLTTSPAADTSTEAATESSSTASVITEAVPTATPEPAAAVNPHVDAPFLPMTSAEAQAVATTEPAAVVVAATLPQRRVLDIAPASTHADDLAALFSRSFKVF